jgi:transcriptional regulator with XRE-family HTH domain
MFRNFYGLTQEQLAKLLQIEHPSIVYYETGKTMPSISTLLKAIKVFSVSLDYFILFDKCQYSKNLKLLNLGQLIDRGDFSGERKTIESNIRMFLKSKHTEKVYKQDIVDVKLSNSFNKNIKILRNLNNMTQLQLGEMLNISKSLVAQYELNSFPPLDRLADLSNIFDISIHALITGEKLCFYFENKVFGEDILLADHFLSLEQHKILITLMEAVLKNS